MKSTFLIIMSVLAISESAFSMERENSGNLDPISTTIVIAGLAATSIYNTYNTPAPHTDEILLVFDDEQLAALQETVVAVDDESAHNRRTLKALFRRLASYYYATASSTPTLDLAWLLNMREVVWFTLIAAETAAKDSLRHVAKDEAKAAARASALHAAVNANDKISSWEPFCRGATGTAVSLFFHTATYVQNMARYTAKPGATKQEVAQAAYEAYEQAALNWLLENIEFVTTTVLPWFLKDLGADSITVTNPFASSEELVPFVNEHYGNLKVEEMIFLAPWLVLIVPINAVPEIHRPLFIHLRAMLIWPKVAPLMLPQTDTGHLAELPRELVEMILFTFFELMGPHQR